MKSVCFSFEKFFAGAGLDKEKAAPQPWLEPSCPKFGEGGPEGHEYLNILVDQGATPVMTNHLLDARTMEKLTSLSPAKDLREFGARLEMALRQEVKPSWILYVMAGGYWHLKGNADASRTCYFNAISKVGILPMQM